jgi:hypothetical protein
MFADLTLSRRLERAEAQGNLDFVEARAAAFPEDGAEWAEIEGAFAMFDGPASPLTQTFCLGLFNDVTSGTLNRIEEFYANRNAPVFHEVSPLVDIEVTSVLSSSGYKPVEFTNVLFCSIQDDASLPLGKNDRIKVRRIATNEHELWAKTAAQGWSEYPELAEFMNGLAQVTANKRDGLSFIAELEGEPIATGAMTIHGGVALLAGASTIPEGRKKGAQNALLSARLRYAVQQGCDVAMMCALPGSASQRNAERQGFRVAYTRIKWHLPHWMSSHQESES